MTSLQHVPKIKSILGILHLPFAFRLLLIPSSFPHLTISYMRHQSIFTISTSLRSAKIEDCHNAPYIMSILRQGTQYGDKNPVSLSLSYHNKIMKTGSLNNRCLFLTVQGSRKFNIKVQIIHFLQIQASAHGFCKELRKKNGPCVSFFLSKDTDIIMGLSLTNSSNSN